MILSMIVIVKRIVPITIARQRTLDQFHLHSSMLSRWLKREMDLRGSIRSIASFSFTSTYRGSKIRLGRPGRHPIWKDNGVEDQLKTRVLGSSYTSRYY